jgi:hypothetical protein
MRPMHSHLAGKNGQQGSPALRRRRAVATETHVIISRSTAAMQSPAIHTAEPLEACSVMPVPSASACII